MKLDREKIEDFLYTVDKSFPIPLSEKQDLHEFAEKLYEKGTVCFAEENGKICSMLAGYTENVVGNVGYISVLATLPEERGKGFAERLIREFLDIAGSKGLDAVHLYAVKDNFPAVRMYEKVGFVEWHPVDEPRPKDLHLIYYFQEKK